jgi:hypothetical protein
MKSSYILDTTLNETDGLDPTDPKIEVLLIQTPMMSKNYKHYHDIVFMDATYNTNKFDLRLAVLSGISSEGKNIILAICLMARETAQNYIWLLTKIKEMNQDVEPKVIMTDFDASMCQAIETVY